jgi:ribosomal protein L11 methyltransferase
MWVSVTLETDAAHADALSEALLAAGAISVSVEDAQAGTD